jgi:hypothetical protein
MMIRSLVGTYLLNLAGSLFLLSSYSLVGLIVLDVGTSVGDILHRAIFWGSLAAAFLTYFELLRRNLWPLFDNLRLSRYLLLGLCVLSVQLVNLLLLWL